MVSPSLARAGGAVDADARRIQAIDRMMVGLAPLSARASATIRKEYRIYSDLLVLDALDTLQHALFTGGLVPLPEPVERYNVRPRTDGPAPIAEKDLENQASYVAARPAAMGALLSIASQVTSGPVEVTSLVRHTEYQAALRATNPNAATSIPMHTMGLAVDIALINTPLKTIREIRDVLCRMQDRGEILFIGERRQLVFHVVPHPSRLGYFSDIYARALAGLPLEAPIGAATLRQAISPLVEPAVHTAIISIEPTDEYADEWWASGDVRGDLSVAVTAPALVPAASPVAPAEPARPARGPLARWASRCASLFAVLFESARALF